MAKPWILRWLIAEDETLGVVLTLNPFSRRTMSETFARWRRDGNAVQKRVGNHMCDALDLVDKGHCDRVLAAAESRDRSGAPPGPA